jgi:hypothetical protein
VTANHSGTIGNVEAHLLVIFGYCMGHTASSNRSPLQDLIDNSVNIWEHREVSNDGRGIRTDRFVQPSLSLSHDA